VTSSDENDHWMIEWVATKPEFRRRGLVNRLLLEALGIGSALSPSPRHVFPASPLLPLSPPPAGKQSGYTRAQISAVVENVGAVSAYKKVPQPNDVSSCA
jgi:predicted acetyltransferase